ncbi:hypothetical protein [Streptomyces sp. B93]|uniref:hypothetical protein n=1 Tax=Streptomyces sp. B93 TaxID=2824875 RepID=UPI001B37A6CA|nr:hypothetical protein [Streptomyces sp. B93]MBQ1092256.1 hypothetical protein [Streptomyces sp. B93]
MEDAVRREIRTKVPAPLSGPRRAPADAPAAPGPSPRRTAVAFAATGSRSLPRNPTAGDRATRTPYDSTSRAEHSTTAVPGAARHRARQTANPSATPRPTLSSPLRPTSSSTASGGGSSSTISTVRGMPPSSPRADAAVIRARTEPDRRRSRADHDVRPRAAPRLA